MGNACQSGKGEKPTTADTHPKAKTKLVFLDVDGVLNSVASRKRTEKLAHELGTTTTAKQRKREGITLPNFDEPDAEMVRLLANIVKSTGAEVVLSTTWRLIEDKRRHLMTILADHSVHPIGDTPNLEGEPRSNTRPDEIAAFLEAFGAVAGWLAIDDLPLVRLDAHRSKESLFRLTTEHFVHTTDAEGLTAALAQEAIAKLGAPPR